MFTFEENAYLQGASLVAGCDEAGRGCLAGPVVAAAVFIPKEHLTALAGVNDSKQLSEKKRLAYFELILQYADIGLGIIEAPEIDEINIYEASRKAMINALKNIEYDYVLTDAMPIYTLDVPVEAIIKGDQKSLSIAAASIVAKCVRDEIMKQYGSRYPFYLFEKHKGYGTKLHLTALDTYGVIDGLHRKTYAPVRALLEEQMTLFE